MNGTKDNPISADYYSQIMSLLYRRRPKSATDHVVVLKELTARKLLGTARDGSGTAWERLGTAQNGSERFGNCLGLLGNAISIVENWEIGKMVNR